MRKTFATAVLALAAVGVAAGVAGPVHADDPGSDFGPGVNAANNWNFTAAAVCLQEVAVVPVLGNWVGDHLNNCSNGNVIDHTGK
ncbi:hypothetical protein [Herbidospora yilanensis]|uniref:hypothetical protein n=1 Tax=Herbidospora yilanensis TaxID=354426 RepID=UPI0007860732|nr:hypothetical protein [Herbidospora yilanensis]